MFTMDCAAMKGRRHTPSTETTRIAAIGVKSLSAAIDVQLLFDGGCSPQGKEKKMREKTISKLPTPLLNLNESNTVGLLLLLLLPEKCPFISSPLCCSFSLHLLLPPRPLFHSPARRSEGFV